MVCLLIFGAYCEELKYSDAEKFSTWYTGFFFFFFFFFPFSILKIFFLIAIYSMFMLLPSLITNNSVCRSLTRIGLNIRMITGGVLFLFLSFFFLFFLSFLFLSLFLIPFSFSLSFFPLSFFF